MPNVTAWAHLPNAKHIDTILADVKARPDVWASARDASLIAALLPALDAAWAIAQDATCGAAWAALRAAAPDVARDVAWGAIHALLAWDDSARMLDMSPAALRTLIDIAEGDVKHQAGLLLPAVIALNTLKET